MSRLKILLTGAGGQVGWELQRTLAPLGEVLAVDHQQMDLADPQQIRDFVRASQPSLIVNPAAYTAVDKAERKTKRAGKKVGKAADDAAAKVNDAVQ